MVDIETPNNSSSGSEPYGGRIHPSYSRKSPRFGWDINRLLNATAVWSIILFWVWICFYWILQYAPMPLIHEPGSKSNDYKYTDIVVGAVQNAMCPSDSSGEPISSCVWYFPAFICFTIVAVLVRRTSFRPHPTRFRLAGDMDFVLFSWIAIAIPLIIFFCFYMYKKWPSDGRAGYDTQAEWIAALAGTFANRIGFLGFWFLTFFMIPATRHGPILAALGWHPYHACTIHMFCGWGSFWSSWIHFVCYIIKYSVSTYDFPNYHYIFPPAMCFTWNTKDGGAVNATTGDILYTDDGMPEPPDGYENCGKFFSGFYGTIAITFFTILVVASMKHVRRYRYQVFYFTHIICAPLFILFVSMHWKLTYQYFWPSLFYYFATQAPYLLQHNRNTIRNYGMKITGVMDIPCRQSPKKKEADDDKEEEEPQRSLVSRIFSPDAMDWLDEQINRQGPQAKSIEHCVSFDFAVTEQGFAQFYPGMYGNIWCPDVSVKSHPFSITHVPGQTNQLRIIFRVFGKWTDLVARSLIQLPCPGHQQQFLPIPKLMMDGFHGPNHLVGSAFNHDKVIIVTAGIGITAFLSMFTEMIEILCLQEDGMFMKRNEIQGVPLTQEFVLHWTCRDENLIKYITDEYFRPLLDRAARVARKRRGSSSNSSSSSSGNNNDNDNDASHFQGVRCQIHIHRTGPAGQKTINPSSLWLSFRDKTERGVQEIDYGLLGTFGVPWSPYRFSFGRWESLWQHIPSILMFCSILWCSYFFSIKVHFWLQNNVFDLPVALNYFLRILDFIPTLFVSFVIGWMGHVLMDWTENVQVKKNRSEYMATTTYKTDAGSIDSSRNDSSLSLIGIPEGDEDENNNSEFLAVVDTTATIAIPEAAPTFVGVNVGGKMITLLSTAGRPSFDELVETSDIAQRDSTGIYLCGPEVMVASCKKAAGLGCQLAGERLQMAVRRNKFVFYEEKFEW